MKGKVGASFALSAAEVAAIVKAELERQGKTPVEIKVEATHDIDKSDGKDGSKVVVTVEFKL